MDEINKIRKAFFTTGESKHKIAKRFNRSWDTINRIVDASREKLEERGKRPNSPKRVATPEVVQAVDKYLEEEVQKKVKRKQRYRAKIIYKELSQKGIYKGSLRTMQDIVSELRVKRGQAKKKSFLPLEFPLGSALQVDHGEAEIEVDGIPCKGYLFVASVPGHVLRYCQIFPTKSTESWGEFHERAFRFFGGIFPRVVYDNDSVLVKKVIGRERKQTSFSLTLEEHYGFESHFCNLAAGNEKGAVENGVGYCRRNFLPGLPNFADWNTANSSMEGFCLKDIETEKHYKTQENLFSLFSNLKDILQILPQKKEWYKKSDCRVDSFQLVVVNRYQYSVPERFVGSHVRVLLSVSEVKILKDEEIIACHERQYDNKDSLQLDHYLEQLRCKPSALWDCKAVRQHQFDPRLLELWGRLSDKYPGKEASQQFVQILFLSRQYSLSNFQEAVELTLKYGAIDHSSVENILIQLTTPEQKNNAKNMMELMPKVEKENWEFDLSGYAELCMGVGS